MPVSGPQVDTRSKAEMSTQIDTSVGTLMDEKALYGDKTVGTRGAVDIAPSENYRDTDSHGFKPDPYSEG